MNAANTTPTLADFEAWVLKKRRNALDRLSAGGATGAAFEVLFAECSKFNGTYEALLDFADDNDARTSANTPATSASKKA